MRNARETADLSGFLICLCLGFAFSFEVLIPGLQGVDMQMMKYLFGVGFGFGLGVCFYLIWIPIQRFIEEVYGGLCAWLESRSGKSGKGLVKGQGGDPSGGAHGQSDE